jgi:hypothetical protein
MEKWDMRFGPFGSVVQLEPGTEGFVLRQAGLLRTGGEAWEVEIEPTPLLRSLFTVMPETVASVRKPHMFLSSDLTIYMYSYVQDFQIDLGLRHDVVKPGFDASVDPTDARNAPGLDTSSWPLVSRPPAR